MLQLLIISFLTLLASVTGTITGFGLSTIMIPIVLFFLPYSEALVLVAIIHWFHSLWKVALFKTYIDWRLMVFFGIPALLFSIVGASLVHLHSDMLMHVLGLFLISYALIIIFFPSFSIAFTNFNAVFGGGLSGFSAGIFGIGGAIRSLFLSAYNLKKEVYISTTGLIGIGIDSARLATYFMGGQYLSSKLAYSLLLLIPLSFLGSWIARHIVHHIAQNQFRTIVASFLLVVGIKLAFFS